MTTMPTVGPTTTSTLPSTAPQAIPVGDAPPMLPGTHDLMCSGDAGAMIAALAVESGRSQKKAALEQRRNAEATETAEQNAQIQALRDKADLVRIQGVVDGAMTLGEGLLDFGKDMNAASAEGAKSEGRLGDQASADARAARYGGGAKLVKATGQVVDGLFKGAIADKDTDAQVHEQLATRAKRAVEDATGDYEDAKKLMEKALDFYKEYTGAKNGAVSAAIHRA